MVVSAYMCFGNIMLWSKLQWQGHKNLTTDQYMEYLKKHNNNIRIWKVDLLEMA